MYLLATASPEIITNFLEILRKKGPASVVRSLPELLQALPREPAKLVLIDFHLLAGDPKAEILAVRQLAPDARMLVVSARLTPELELSLLGAGVAACCGDRISEGTITRIVDTVLDGGTWISSAALPLLLKGLHGLGAARAVPEQPRAPAADCLDALTPRERQIAELVGSGASNKLIARQLDITDRTVKAHLSTIFHKLGVTDRLQLALQVKASAAPPAKAVG